MEGRGGGERRGEERNRETVGRDGKEKRERGKERKKRSGLEMRK